MGEFIGLADDEILEGAAWVQRRVDLGRAARDRPARSFRRRLGSPRDARRAIKPDLPVPLTYRDWRAGRDAALEAIGAYRATGEGVRPPNTNWQRKSQQ